MQRTWSWQGDIPADECVRVGTVSLEVPDTTGDLVLDVELRGHGPADPTYHARYGTRVASHG